MMSEMTKKKDEIKLSDHFTYGRLLKFTLPSIAMMIFTSIYGVVDGIFVSNYVGETPFAALNLIMPYIMIFFGNRDDAWRWRKCVGCVHAGNR